MQSMVRSITISKTRPLQREFDDLAKSAERVLGDAGFMVTRESPNSLTLSGPPHYDSTQALSAFSKMVLQKRGQQLTLTAEFRSDHSPSARWNKNAFIGLIALSNILGLAIFLSDIPASQPELLPLIIIPIVVLGLIVAFKLRPRLPNNAPEAKLALDQVLDKVTAPKT